MYSDLKKTTIRRLKRSKAARERFVESHLTKSLAYQLRALRDHMGLSQIQLAEQVGMNQNSISRLESPKYGKYTITTLKRLAAFFDVGLVVRFVPFSELVDWVSGTPYLNQGLNAQALAVPGFQEEDRSHVFEEVSFSFSASTQSDEWPTNYASSNTAIFEDLPGEIPDVLWDTEAAGFAGEREILNHNQPIPQIV